MSKASDDGENSEITVDIRTVGQSSTEPTCQLLLLLITLARTMSARPAISASHSAAPAALRLLQPADQQRRRAQHVRALRSAKN